MQGKHFLPVVLFLLLTTGSFSNVQAQYYGLHPWDAKNFNLGFIMGLNYNRYNLKEQINVCDDGVCLNRLEVVPRLGLSMGIISNLNIHPQVNFRFIPTISLEQRDFNYYFRDSSEVVQRKIEASYVNLPFLFQFKGKYYKRTRFYVLAGPQIGFNVGSNKKVRDDPNLLKITTQDISLVVGAGLGLYGDRIKLSPELRYSAGLFNIYEPIYTSHANAIGLLYSQVLSIIVNFE